MQALINYACHIKVQLKPSKKQYYIHTLVNTRRFTFRHLILLTISLTFKLISSHVKTNYSTNKIKSVNK